MLKQLRHKRFNKTMNKIQLSSIGCQWYTQAIESSVPSGNDDNKNKRPWSVHT